MKSFLSKSQITMLIQAVILSKIDYCNCLYYGCQPFTINQLQIIQNRACRLIFGLRKREPTEEKLVELHWLRVQERIEFKFLLLVYKCIHGLAPLYLSELINVTESRHISLHVKNPQESFNRPFRRAGPLLWNRLPPSVRDSKNIDIFKKNLKTHLFKRSYNV